MENGPDSLGALVGAAKVNGDDSIPLSLGHGLEGLVTEDASVGDQDMHAAELLKGNSNDLLAVLSRAHGGGSLATCLGDLVDDTGSTLFRYIVDDDVGTEFGVHESVRSAEASTSTGDDNSLAIEADFGGGLRVGGELLGSLEFTLGIM